MTWNREHRRTNSECMYSNTRIKYTRTQLSTLLMGQVLVYLIKGTCTRVLRWLTLEERECTTVGARCEICKEGYNKKERSIYYSMPMLRCRSTRLLCGTRDLCGGRSFARRKVKQGRA